VTGLIPIVLLGTLILIFSGRLLVQWSRQSHAGEVTIEDYSQARAALDSVFVETAAIKRIFSSDIRRFFLKERKRLAIQWLRMTQRQVAQLMDLHLKLAGYTYEPSPSFEFKLTVKHLCFMFVSNVLLAFLWLRGPFEAVKLVTYTLQTVEYFGSVFSLRLEDINPVKLSPASKPQAL
jgi:hypothetical protein